MAIGDSYVSPAELKGYLQFEGTFTGRDEDLEDAALAASQQIDLCCDRQFNKADEASERIYEVTPGGRLVVDDFWTTDGLIVNNGQPMVLTDLDLRPRNGVVSGQPGWPYTEIRGPLSPGLIVRVTAKWGWDAIPGPVVSATKILAAQLFHLSQAPLGVAGFSQFGAQIRVRDFPPQVKRLLAPYDRNRLQVG